MELRNTIEMQAITALAHLQCCILYFLDISEQCGYTLEEQLKLFKSIRPLFTNKQVMMVANKTDVIAYDNLSAEKRALIEDVAREGNAEVLPMSNVSEENVDKLKVTACDKLLEARVDAKLSASRVKNDVLSRITVAVPKPRDGQVRGAYIPESVQRKADAMDTSTQRVTEKDLMNANGGAGVYVCDYRKYYLLEEDEWKFDTIPEFMDGKNVMDFFDADIEERLAALEAEEAELEAQGAYAPEEEDEDDLDEQELLLYKAVKDRQEVARKVSHKKAPAVPRKFTIRGRSEEAIKEHLESHGLESAGVIEHTRGRKRSRSTSVGANRAARSASNAMDVDGEDEDDVEIRKPRSRTPSARDRSVSVQSRSRTKGPRADSVKPSQVKEVKKRGKTLERQLVKYARGGPGDREHYPKLVKHLNSGKKSNGTSTIGR